MGGDRRRKLPPLNVCGACRALQRRHMGDVDSGDDCKDSAGSLQGREEHQGDRPDTWRLAKHEWGSTWVETPLAYMSSRIRQRPPDPEGGAYATASRADRTDRERGTHGPKTKTYRPDRLHGTTGAVPIGASRPRCRHRQSSLETLSRPTTPARSSRRGLDMPAARPEEMSSPAGRSHAGESSERTRARPSSARS